MSGVPARPAAERMWNRVDKSGTCWIWTGAPGSHGYGEIIDGGKLKLVHRVSYEAAKGTVPAGLQIDHVCRNRLCVRPDHLEAVTQAENIRRAGRYAGQTHANCKYGHPITTDNIHTDSAGQKSCLACYKARNLRPRIPLKERFSN